tara:strand:- start:74 stop:730 length:657 start_codon:yes stop_codon:yes gene_type:complete
MNILGEEHPSVWAIELGEVNSGTGLTTVGQVVPEGTPGSSEFKPLRHKQKLLDDLGYYISRDGRILSIKGNRKPKISSPKRSRTLDKWTSKEGHYIKPANVNLSVPIGYFEDYEYTASTTFKYGKKYISKNKTKPNVRFHKVAIETWKPFEEYCNEADPPIPLEDWENTPESVKKFVLECYYVDHIDGDTSNASVDNLRYCTPPRNSNYIKGKSGGPK